MLYRWIIRDQKYPHSESNLADEVKFRRMELQLDKFLNLLILIYLILCGPFSGRSGGHSELRWRWRDHWYLRLRYGTSKLMTGSNQNSCQNKEKFEVIWARNIKVIKATVLRIHQIRVDKQMITLGSVQHWDRFWS